MFQDENDTAPFEEIKGLVEDALGCPLEEIFESFDGADPKLIDCIGLLTGLLDV